MTPSAIPATPQDAAPELARRLGVILAGLAAVVAMRFLRMPRYVGLIVPLFGRLTRAARRFAGVMARPVVARAGRPGACEPSGRERGGTGRCPTDGGLPVAGGARLAGARTRL